MVVSIVDVIIDKLDDAIDNINGSENAGAGSEDVDSNSGNGATNPDSSSNPSEGGNITIIPEGKILVKGGSISGEDEQPYEVVSRGANNIKEIVIYSFI